MLTLRSILARNEAWYPHHPAYVEGGRVITHAQYTQRVRRLTSALEDRGVRRGGRVAILAMNSIAYCEVYGACEWSGTLAVTINFRLAAPEADWILADSAPAALFFEEQYVDLVDSIRGKHPSLSLICIGAAPSWAEGYEDLLAAGDASGCSSAPEAEDPVSLIYTSGTTGRPKGVLKTHRIEVRTAEMLALEMDIAPHSRALLATPLFHVGARNVRLAQMLRYGACVIERGFDAAAFAALVQRERINTVFLVAAQLQMVMDLPDVSRYDLSSLVTVGMAGAPVPLPLLERAIRRIGRAIMVQYGMTEGQIASLYRHELRPDGTPEEVRRIASVGHALANGELRVVDDAGNDCPQGKPGEVWFRNDSVMTGYWNNAAATAATLADGWMRTGDIGVLDTAGYLFLVDRKKDVILSGGENIYSREVEEALHRHPAVSEAAVIGIPDERWGESVKAYVVLKPGENATQEELIAFARTQIAKYKCPKIVALLAELPRLTTGKVNKIALRELQRDAGGST